MDKIDIVCQVGISIFGATAIWLVGRRDEKVRRFGYLCGICSQPFWFTTCLRHKHWGIFILSFFYAYSWLAGAWNHWVVPWREKRNGDKAQNQERQGRE